MNITLFKATGRSSSRPLPVIALYTEERVAPSITLMSVVRAIAGAFRRWQQRQMAEVMAASNPMLSHSRKGGAL